MHYHFIAETMRDTTDKLLGVEINARFTSDTVQPLHPDFIISAWDSEQKRNFMLEQIRLIAEKRDWFERNSLICTLKLIDEMALLAIGDPAIKSALQALPFIALELSERFLTNTVCLNNLLINSLRAREYKCNFAHWENLSFVFCSIVLAGLFTPFKDRKSVV